MLSDLARILFDEGAILRRLDELAQQIAADYRDQGELTVVAVLNGSFMFMSDLLRRIPLPLHIDCVRAASYLGTQSSGTVQFRDSGSEPLVAARHVLILDDILDSGRTLHAVRARLAVQNPRSVKLCVLLRKLRAREMPVEADYAAFEIGDEFVVGYGLDFMERYRNLPCIGVLRGDIVAEGLRQIAATKSA